ncbi:Alpha-1,4-glucan:maltose-1-phosphate maltosyltransferase [Ralstonia mannitolilytica]|uniref:maltotransferase domain-containing protein n=1 Tax=Ralstonia mannitolilytica TaxID=105219 RepID=UPI0028F5F18B|nr:maltotransferase domain-containing protein [Ralstonia mannitolilytica]CAJ0686709.1 Alpha-1,4-glucan:maltose-1-phosphate maltosyltransferase [Ralstonia mannitolilytica]
MPQTKKPNTTAPRKNTAALKAAKPPGSEARAVARTADRPRTAPPLYAPAICYLHPLQLGRLDRWEGVLDRIASLGFDHVLMAPPFQTGAAGNVFVTRDHAQLHHALGGGPADAALATLAQACRARGLTLLLDLVIDRVATDAPLRADHPDWFASHAEDGDALDPRLPPSHLEVACFRHDNPHCGDAILAWWTQQLRAWAALGIGGFRCEAPARLPAERWLTLMADTRAAAPADPGLRFLAWTPGMDAAAVDALAGAGFDATFSSLRWWDFRASWMVEEHARLAAVAPPIATVEAPFGTRYGQAFGDAMVRERAYRRIVHVADTLDAGWLMPLGFERGALLPMLADRGDPSDQQWIDAHAAFDLSDAVRDVNATIRAARDAGTVAPHAELRMLTGPDAPATAMLRADGPDLRAGDAATLVVINPDLHMGVSVHADHFLPGVAGGFTRGVALDLLTEPIGSCDDALRPNARPLAEIDLLPGDVQVWRVFRSAPVRYPSAEKTAKRARTKADDAKAPVNAAIAAPRIGIEHVQPAVDDGRFAVKRLVGDDIVVEADVLMDGHDQLAVQLLWRAQDEDTWQRVPMVPLGNDRWRGVFRPERLGRHVYAVAAWRDAFGTYRSELEKKHAAGVDVTLELEEGARLVAQAAEHAPADAPVGALHKLAQLLADADPAHRLKLLLDPPTAHVMAQASHYRPFYVETAPYPLEVERGGAAFASWYELFPRSASGDEHRHGTFDDVIRRLGAIRGMGFDVLYFPPIHPIGRTNRKGRNNSLQAAPDDPGSPYAIGAEEGGHDAIHPQLGTLEDFRRLRDAAREKGLELALDFAIQCSPDHPWLREHPGWFAWRPDGSIKYAENPPKKYEDIVNVDFYANDAKPALWLALRDVVMFWADEGIRLFRVDNPHTKPLPFWEWMIGEVRARYPDAVFLSEAFTRPKVMYRLAKVGFSQSYTYFTWRHTKQEFIDYLTELTRTPVREYFRPHFFVNTPDINPVFLQTSGRPGFLIRAALAATLSGLWGVYNGFELCEGRAIPGKEEYLDSEKYQLRAWDHNRPGNIVKEIALLNRIRRANPALHSHLGVTFQPASGEHILFFSKSTPPVLPTNPAELANALQHGQQDRFGDNTLFVAINLDPHHAHASDIELPLWQWGLPDHGALMAENLVTGQRTVWRGKWQHIRLEPEQPFAIWRVRPALPSEEQPS